MGTANDWYKGVEREVYSLEAKMSRSDTYLYKLDLLLEKAQKVGEFSSECKECQVYQNGITNLVSVVKNLPPLNDEGEIANYSKPVKRITKHLRQKHDYGGIGKLRGILVALACWVIGAILVCSGIGFVAMTHESQQNHAMLWLFVSLGAVAFIGGLYYLIKGLRSN